MQNRNQKHSDGLVQYHAMGDIHILQVTARGYFSWTILHQAKHSNGAQSD